METTSWNDFAAVVEQAQAAQRAGDLKLAYEFFSRASELNPNDPAGWRGRALTSAFADDALVSLAYAVALEPNNVEQRQELAARLESRTGSALRQDAAALVEIGQRLARVGLMSEARCVLRRAAELDATNEQALLWLAATIDNPTEAQQTLQQLLAVHPDNAVARAGLATVQRQIIAAPPASAEAMPPVPADDPASELVHQAEQALTDGDRPGAYQLYVQATEVSTRSEAAWLGRARTTDDIDEALTCLEQVLAINPDNTAARESRTYFRVRKLRAGMRKTDARSEAPLAPAIARVARADAPGAHSRALRAVVLLLIIIVLIVTIAFYYLRPF